MACRCIGPKSLQLHMSMISVMAKRFAEIIGTLILGWVWGYMSLYVAYWWLMAVLH